MSIEDDVRSLSARGTIFTTKQQVARDLVRRAKKLEGVDK